MKQKSTGDLTGELTSTASFDAYLRANEPFFSEQGVAELLTQLYKTKDLTKAELARRSGISEVYLHQVFAGRRIPSRDRLLCICIGLSLTLEETQRMLTQGSYALLYPRTKRDAIIWGRFKDTLHKHFHYWESNNLSAAIEQAVYYFNYERPVRKLKGKPPVLFRTELVA